MQGCKKTETSADEAFCATVQAEGCTVRLVAKKVVVLSLVALLVVFGGMFMLDRISKSYWEKQELLKYEYYSGGNMNGNSHRETLTAGEDYALLTISNADWHNEDPTVTEYQLPKSALDEIKKVFLTYRMFSWEGCKISNYFVADKETTTYSFVFSDDDVSFSSQIYPESYRKKLNEIDAIINKYKDPEL